MTQEEILKYALQNGMIDMSYMQEYIEMNKRKELLSKHPYKIWKGSDGKYHTYLPDEDKKRVPRKRNTQKEIEDLIVEFWKEKQENPTVEEVFNEWNDRRVRLKKIKKATHLRYTQDFKRYYKEFGNRKIKSLEPEEIEDFLEEQISEYDLTAKAFSELKIITRGLLKRAKKRKLITFNGTDQFDAIDKKLRGR